MFFLRCLARLERYWRYMQMGTCVWHLGPRRGRSIPRASQPSPWRWTPTWWQLKTPANLEVRPLAGTRGLHRWVELCLYCLHVSIHPFSPFQLHLCHSCFQTKALAAPVGWLSLSFPHLLHQASVLHVPARCVDWEMLWQHPGHLSSCQTLSVVSWLWLNLFSLCVYSPASCDLRLCMFLTVCDRFCCMNGHSDSFLSF